MLLDASQKDDMVKLRLWNNLKIAFEGACIWIKDFDYNQINSIEVKSIPYKTIFYSREGKLYLQNSLLPDRFIPSLLWTPIGKALPITLPSLNHNYFGIQKKIEVNLIPSEEEHEVIAMIASKDALQQYIETAPSIRLYQLLWSVLNNNTFFIYGNPQLPIQGEVYWKRGDCLLPAGFDFELYMLANTYNSLLNPIGNFFILWNIDGTYSLIPKNELTTLSLSSFRLTQKSQEARTPH